MENTQQARDIDTLLAQYADSHRNHTNELIHIVCVPTIIFTLLGILWVYPSRWPRRHLARRHCILLQTVRRFAVGMLAMTC